MTTAQKLAYLKGVIDASNITDPREKKIYDAITDLLESMVEDIEFNTENIDNIDSRLGEVDEDLELVESILYDDDIAEEDFDDEDESDFDSYSDAYEDEAEAFADDDFIDLEEAEMDDDEADIDAAEEDAAEDIDEDIDEDIELEDEEGEEMYEIECPACHETIYLQESVILEGSVDCPNCGEPLEFDIEFEEE